MAEKKKKKPVGKKKVLKAIKKKPVKKPVKKAASKPAPKPEPRPVTMMECQVCGYRLVVDRKCNCVEEHVLVCCGQPLQKVETTV